MTSTPEFSLDRPFSEATLAFVDVETTGLNSAGGDRVCEIAIIRQEPGGTEREFVSFIDPEREISPGAFAVNKITPEMLAGAPRFPELIDRIEDLLSLAVLVAHNARFDIGFLEAEYARCERTFPARPVIDTVLLARKHFHFASNRLEAVARALGVKRRQEHRALADTRMTQKILQVMVERTYGNSPLAVAELVESPGDLPYVPVNDLNELDARELPPSLVDLIRQGGELRIVYIAATGQQTARRVRVKQVVRLGSHVYLAAECLERNAERHFRMDRIVDWSRPEGEVGAVENDA